jgi:hypothetical protein
MLTTPTTEEQMLERVLASLEDATTDDAHFERRMIDASDALIKAYRAHNPHASDRQSVDWTLRTARKIALLRHRKFGWRADCEEMRIAQLEATRTGIARCEREIGQLRDAAIADLTDPLTDGKRMPPECHSSLRKWESDLAMLREAEADLVQLGRGKTGVPCES